MHLVLANFLGGPRLPRNSVVRLNDLPDMTIAVYFGHKITEQYFWGEKVIKIGVLYKLQGPVVQSIVSLTNSLRDQLV